MSFIALICKLPMPLKGPHCFQYHDAIFLTYLLSFPNTLMESTAHKAGQDQSSKSAGTSPSGSSASKCSSPSRPPPYSSSSPQSSRKENVEDVWKEINLASLHDYPITTTSTTTNSTDTSATITQTRYFLGSDRTSSLFDKMGLSKGAFLSLNSASGCQYTGMTNTAGPLTSSCKRRASENADEFHEKKLKRLMKNRASAARSRARKQAYTNELELEVARLRQENARLRRFKEMAIQTQPYPQSLLANNAQNQKTSTLRRTLTSLF